MIYRFESEEYGTAYVWRPQWFIQRLRKRLERKGLTTLGRLEYKPSMSSDIYASMVEHLEQHIHNRKTWINELLENQNPENKRFCLPL